MKKTKKTGQSSAEAPIILGDGQEVHQQATSEETLLTTNQGVPIADNQNSLKAGARGPVLAAGLHSAREDHAFRP